MHLALLNVLHSLPQFCKTLWLIGHYFQFTVENTFSETLGQGMVLFDSLIFWAGGVICIGISHYVYWVFGLT